MNDLEKALDTWSRKGWYPVKWAHHPKEIRDALREIGLRPQIKECYANCQRFMVGIHRPSFSDLSLSTRIQYREGFAFSLIPFDHAWLTLDGDVVDLTADPERKYVYLLSHRFGPMEIINNMIKKKRWCSIDPHWIAKNQERAWRLAGESRE